MANFKVTCDVENEEKGRHDYDIFVRDVENEIEAEKLAKYHFLIEKDDYAFYKAKKIVEV